MDQKTLEDAATGEVIYNCKLLCACNSALLCTFIRIKVHVEEEVARGEAVGAVWTITGGQHDTTALCVRDSELVRMSKSAFKVRAVFIFHSLPCA